MSIPIRLRVKYMDGTVIENIRAGTIGYGNDLDDENTWKRWWDQMCLYFQELKNEGYGPQKIFDMDRVEWFQPMDKEFKIYVNG